jgi:tetratricopeptide (TPR) repeat protein
VRDVAAQHKEDSTLTLRLATIDALEGKRAAAQTTVREILEKNPKNPGALQMHARLLLADGKLDEALATVKQLEAAEGASRATSDAYALAGQIHTAKGHTEEAVAAYTKVLSLEPRRLDAQMALARLYLARNDGKQAVTYAQQVLSIQPGNLNARVLLVRGDVLSGKIENAEQDLAPLQKAYPQSPTVANLQALVQLSRNQPEAARASYERALKSAPRDYEALTGSIRLAIASGRPAEALQKIDTYLRGGKPDFNGLVLASRTYLAAGKPQEAEKLLQSAIEADPRKLETYSLLGQLYAKQNRIDDATRVYADMATRDEKSVPAHTMLGLLFEQQGKVDEAEKSYKKALAVEPRAAVAANNLAMIHVNRNSNLEDARQLAETAQRELPDDPNVNDTLGWIYHKLGRGSAALQYLEKSVKTSPTDPTFKYHLGAVYYAAGDWEKARQQLTEALKLKSDFDGAADARATLAKIG